TLATSIAAITTRFQTAQLAHEQGSKRRTAPTPPRVRRADPRHSRSDRRTGRIGDNSPYLSHKMTHPDDGPDHAGHRGATQTRGRWRGSYDHDPRTSPAGAVVGARSRLCRMARCWRMYVD